MQSQPAPERHAQSAPQFRAQEAPRFGARLPNLNPVPAPPGPGAGPNQPGGVGAATSPKADPKVFPASSALPNISNCTGARGPAG